MEIQRFVIRKTLMGGWEPFTFSVKSKSFYVKNFSDDTCYVSFDSSSTEENAIRINSDMGEIVYMTSLYDLSASTFVTTLYIKGAGEIEVEAIEWTPLPKAPQPTTGYDTSDATIDAEDVLKGKIAYGADGRLVGTFDGYDTKDADITAADVLDGKIAYGANGKVVGQYIPLDTSDATATADDLLEGETAYVDGVKITGTYTLAGHTVGTATASDIADGETAWVNGVQVTGSYVPPDLSDATATASEILYGKTAYINGGKVTGTYAKIPQVMNQTVDTLTEGDLHGLTSIPQNWQRNNTHLTTLEIPDSVISLDAWSQFSGCTSLTSLKIGKGLTFLSDRMFASCNSLPIVTIPNNITVVNQNAFANCSSLTRTNYEGTLAQWCAIRFALYSSNPVHASHNLYLKNANDQYEEVTGDLVIPNGVTKIGNYAFYYLPTLTSITIPNSVTEIGAQAFINAFGTRSNLTSVTIGSGITKIGSYAFQNNFNLAGVTINSIDPPTLENTEAFVNELSSNYYPIYVPASSVEAYRAATNWSALLDNNGNSRIVAQQ